MGSVPKRLDAASVPTVGGHPKWPHQALLPTVWVLNLRIEIVCEWFAQLREYEDLPRGKTFAIKHVFGGVREDGEMYLVCAKPMCRRCWQMFCPIAKVCVCSQGGKEAALRPPACWKHHRSVRAQFGAGVRDIFGAKTSFVDCPRSHAECRNGSIYTVPLFLKILSIPISGYFGLCPVS